MILTVRPHSQANPFRLLLFRFRDHAIGCVHNCDIRVINVGELANDLGGLDQDHRLSGFDHGRVDRDGASKIQRAVNRKPGFLHLDRAAVVNVRFDAAVTD